MATRPEGTVPPELFYDATEAKKYSLSTRMINIQTEIAQRALDMLALPEDKPAYILDIGCGSGLSGGVLEENGHYWMGCDISKDMIGQAIDGNGGIGSTESTGDYARTDIGRGLPFRPATFDGVISVSAIQWLCYSDSSDADPKVRLNRFFSSLYGILKKDGRAVLQFYPENAAQAVLISQVASKVGFTGGVVVDYPNSSKAKKYYLCLSFERSYRVPTALVQTGNGASSSSSSSSSSSAAAGVFGSGTNANSVTVVGNNANTRRRAGKGDRQRVAKHSKEWVQAKKETRRRRGEATARDSKFTGRRRPTSFA